MVAGLVVVRPPGAEAVVAAEAVVPARGGRMEVMAPLEVFALAGLVQAAGRGTPLVGLVALVEMGGWQVTVAMGEGSLSSAATNSTTQAQSMPTVPLEWPGALEAMAQMARPGKPSV